MLLLYDIRNDDERTLERRYSAVALYIGSDRVDNVANIDTIVSAH